MVKHLAQRAKRLDAVFAALADPTRRRIVERLTRSELTAGAIAADFAVSAPAISRHLKVLERSGLLRRTVVGREHRCRLDPRALRGAVDWLERQERFWNTRFDRLEHLLAHSTDEDEP